MDLLPFLHAHADKMIDGQMVPDPMDHMAVYGGAAGGESGRAAGADGNGGAGMDGIGTGGINAAGTRMPIRIDRA